MKPRLYLSAFLFSFICSLFFTSCGGEVESTSDENKTVNKGIIGVSVLTLGNPFFSVIADNVTREAAKYGYEVIVVDGDRMYKNRPTKLMIF